MTDLAAFEDWCAHQERHPARYGFDPPKNRLSLLQELTISHLTSQGWTSSAIAEVIRVHPSTVLMHQRLPVKIGARPVSTLSIEKQATIRACLNRGYTQKRTADIAGVRPATVARMQRQIRNEK